MKTLLKILKSSVLLVCLFLDIQISQAQFGYIDPTTNPPFPGVFDLVQSGTGTVSFMGGTGGYPSTSLNAFGINTQTPIHMLDVYCGSTGNQNINISSASNNVGYMIGGNMVLWHNGNTSCIYVGVGAGTSGAGANNTAVGYNALYNNTIIS